VKYGQTLQKEEINNLIDELFACKMPYYSPAGKPIVVTVPAEELDKRFSK